MNIDSVSIADLPYSPDALKYGTTTAELYGMRDDVLALLRGRTNIVRVANDYYDSYDKAQSKTVMHYRDYLIAEAALASLRSTLYLDPEHTTLNSRGDRVLEDLSQRQIWPPAVKQSLRSTPQYAGSLGSPAYTFLAAGINEVPLDAFEKLYRTQWSLNGISPDATPSDRLSSLYSYLGNIPGVSTTVQAEVERLFTDVSPGDPGYELLLYSRRNFIGPDDYSDLPYSLFFGTYDKDVVNMLGFLLEEQDARDLQRTLQYSNSIAKPGGPPVLLQSMAMEGYVKAAKALEKLPQEVSYGSLSEFLSSDNPDYAEQKIEVAAGLQLAADAYALLGTTRLMSDADTNKAKVFNNALYWLDSAGVGELAPEVTQSLASFVRQYIPDRSSALPIFTADSPIYAWGDFYEGLQGLPARNTGATLVLPRSYGFAVSTQSTGQVDPLALTRIQPPPSAADSSLRAYTLAPVESGQVTYEQYQNLPVASNVVVAQQGNPSSNLSAPINNYVNMQSSSYEVVNTVQLAPQPRGVLGYEEMIRGLVSHLFRDPVSGESVDKAKVDGAREEHTSRVGGLLLQLKDTHLDSEVKVLKEWSDIVDFIL